jgi:hypothetical protein
LIPLRSVVVAFSSRAGVTATAGAQALTSKIRIRAVKKNVLF